ncbi:amylo-alpha-1,6-glucosidase [Micromonospora deserti]|uniref:amylo-alpha-1,6-glucosidase n=1 Tax=Micromonospora deserti TaxID=2070366 RepID=UPI000DA99944|nr:trehalase family glycosidase [Micromonospora deserti]
MNASSGPVFSLGQIPFSHIGSWFNFSPVIAEGTYADDVHLVSHQTRLHPVLRLTPLAGTGRVDAQVSAVPAVLTWHHHGSTIELAYESAEAVRLRGRGLGLALSATNPELTPFSGAYFLQDPVDGSYLFTQYETGRRYRVTVLAGRVAELTGVQSLGATGRGLTLDGTVEWEIAIEEYESARAPYRADRAFDRVVDGARESFRTFADAVAPWRDDHTPAAELAAYVVWSATVRPAGFVTRPAVLMSKHWMDKVWSWDHCFNALALVAGDPSLAWDQFRLMWDHQDQSGALPDSITHSETLFNFVKPPIHGWAVHRMRRAGQANPGELTEMYRRLERWTTFWLTHRRTPGSPLPHYQHGNDSGWDNATTFDPQRAVESADLAAYLVLQLRELAALARVIGDDDAAGRWDAAATRMRTDLLAHLWNGRRFVARCAVSRRTWSSDSLLDLMPIVLGEELPPDVSARLAERLTAHLTPHGLATELTTSPRYEPDGYWRGPVWAPSTVLVEDGLRRAGHIDLADAISDRFRLLCERSGFAENFDALTGVGLRDRAYTWTASAYLILAAAHQQRRRGAPRPRSDGEATRAAGVSAPSGGHHSVLG